MAVIRQKRPEYTVNITAQCIKQFNIKKKMTNMDDEINDDDDGNCVHDNEFFLWCKLNL